MANEKVKRVPLNVSVLPNVKDELLAFCDERLIGPALIVEKAIDAFLASQKTGLPASERPKLEPSVD